MPDVEEIARQLHLAFESEQLDLLAPLLHPNVQWGDGPSPRACRTASDVLATYGRLFGQGVVGELRDLHVLPHGVIVHLAVTWPENAPEDARREVWQAFRVEDGLIVEIRGNDDEAEARHALVGFR